MSATTTTTSATTAAPDPVAAAADRTAERLRTVVPVLVDPAVRPGPDADLGTVLDALVTAVRADPTPDRVWLLYAAVTGRLPDPDELRAARREIELADAIGFAVWVLDRALDGPTDTRGWGLELVIGQVLVDVDFSARHDLHTGIQRVVRSTLPHWIRPDRPGVVPVVWSPAASAHRRCAPAELDRVLRWGGAQVDVPAGLAADPADAPTLLVPWHSHVVLLEVPPRPATGRLAALAQWSGNSVVGIGYDCIPIVSALLLPAVEPGKFVDHLSVVKHMRHVAGISDSAALEFRGFVDMLAAQGLTGPEVSELALPVTTASASPPPAGAVPSILCVGSFEPRKNQAAVLFAAERLWREGLRFSLRFVGGGGWGTAFPRELRRLRRAGRDVEQLTAISEDELTAAYAASRFTVFVSLHEGYGLPVAESFAHGVPALVTGYGSVAEIGEHGGVVEVDPRDDDAVLEGMRRLLTDDALVATLRAQIAGRPRRSWGDYADELWQRLVVDEPVTVPSGAGGHRA